MANQVLYGFVSLQNVFDQRVTQVGINIVTAAIDRTVAEHNRQLDALMALFVRRTNDYQVRFKTPVAARLQPLDENGRALPIRAAGQYDVAFPVQRAGSAWGANYEASVTMTVQEANNITQTMLMADIRWVRDHILAALFASAGWNFTDDEHGVLAIKGLANGDATNYLLLSGGDSGATDTHYIAQTAAVADGTNPFPVIYKELTEHAENDGEVLVLIPSNVRTAVEGLASFRPVRDPNVQPADTAATLVGRFGAAVPGEIIGYADKCWIAEWRGLPDNTLVGLMTGGERPLAMREPTAPVLQGFKQEAERNDHPWYERQWTRRAGFGGWNRVGAVVYQVGNGDTVFDVPTGYASPMP